MIVKLNDFLKKEEFVNYALEWKIFLYPTDTIYWIWWVWNKTLKKIYKIKQRPQNKKVSIILPGKNIENFINKLKNIIENQNNFSQLEKTIKNFYNNKKWFTIIIKAKKYFFNCLDSFWQEIYNDQTIWIRYLNHPFQNFINKLNLPFITTSANISWQQNITNINQTPEIISKKVDIIVDAWQINNPPSQLIDFTKNEIKIIKRK